MSDTCPNADHLTKLRRRYVIKKHHATRLHYDLRFKYLSHRGILELASFVIVEGPSLDPTSKHHAVRVDDHDARYMDPERVIPPGKYGAGPMLVWDRGDYIALSRINGQPVELATALRDGFVVIELNGEKLKGRFELRFVRKRYREEWSFLKCPDENAVIGSNIVDELPNSVVSNRSLEEIAAGIPAKLKCDEETGMLVDLGDFQSTESGT